MTYIHSCRPWCTRPLYVAMREAMEEEREEFIKDLPEVLF